MKRILAVSGSPRRWGNAELLLEEFLKEFKIKGFVVKKLLVSELKVTPCNNCGYCSRAPKCVFKDDMQMVYKELKRADCVVVASPIYFTNLPGQLKALIDRCQVFWAGYFASKKPLKSRHKRYGIFLSVCGFNSPRMFNCAITMMKILFKVLSLDFYGKILIPGVDAKGDILKKEKSIAGARALAKKLIKEM